MSRATTVLPGSRSARFWPACIGLMAGVLAAGVLAQDAASPGSPTTVLDQAFFATRIRPLLVERCGACHGEERQRGGLASHTPEAITEGGFAGPALVAGKPDESEILRRLRLPPGDDEHMPPDGEPQLTGEQIKLIQSWITAGASFGSPSPAASQPASTTRPAVAAKPAPTGAIRPIAAESDVPRPDPAGLRALRARWVHVELVAQGAHRLRVDFAAVAAKTSDADALPLLEPLLPQIEVLSLARCAIGDQTAARLARAPVLRRLDLRGTRVTDAGVAALAGLPRLDTLVLVQTRLTDAAVEHLAGMPALERVFLFKSGVSSEAVARLREKRPGLRVEAGDSPASGARVEPEFKLGNDAPPPGPPAQSRPVAALGR